jgi:predicted dehydrogenase
MRFALLGSHPAGLEMACALVATGRHELLAYTGQQISAQEPTRWGAAARQVGDLEEVLADPAVEAVIVAGTPANRPAQLRRALQSERHVLCVYPPDRTPDTAYEAAMIQADTQQFLFPIVPDGLHPALFRFAGLARSHDGPVGGPGVLQIEHTAEGEFLLEADTAENKWSLPEWQRLRAIGGEIAEVAALARQEDLEPGQPLLLHGVFESGGLFQAIFHAHARNPRWRAVAASERGRLELFMPTGLQGPAFLSWRECRGPEREEYFPAWDPWLALVKVFEEQLDHHSHLTSARQEWPGQPNGQPAAASCRATVPAATGPSWQDVIRCLELDDAARRSLAKRRVSVLEYPEATEEAGFKGTMTLVGCGLLWFVLVLLILSAWKPWLGWFIVPVLAVFLLLQGLRWVVRRKPEER